MFINRSNETESKLDAEIQSLLDQLNETMQDAKYDALVDRIAKLHKLKTEEKSKPTISPDTMLLVAANIFGILWLARFEKTGVIKAPKAFGFIMKPYR
jgi:hypothetical protein